jgi:hypothetical protein
VVNRCHHLRAPVGVKVANADVPGLKAAGADGQLSRKGDLKIRFHRPAKRVLADALALQPRARPRARTGGPVPVCAPAHLILTVGIDVAEPIVPKVVGSLRLPVPRSDANALHHGSALVF